MDLRLASPPLLWTLLLFLASAAGPSAALKVYTNTWAVHVTGGAEQADRIAAKHGFVNHGNVSADPPLPRVGVEGVLPLCFSALSGNRIVRRRDVSLLFGRWERKDRFEKAVLHLVLIRSGLKSRLDGEAALDEDRGKRSWSGAV